ncbi:MAG: Calcium-transporting ATPase 1 [Candidatus Lokiarchaeum sp. GC14_75]|nr:MAG: Calcium-transporting ATPase 1 [Candidatus Lokiarchaeum sp. GC14_75]
MKMENIQSHAIDFKDVAKQMETSIENGLTGQETQKRLERFGRNELTKEKGKTALQIFIGQFKDFLIYLLIFAILISIVIGIYESIKIPGEWPSEYTDALVILTILIVNAVLGFYQEYQAEKSLESLKKLAPHYAIVRRDGKVMEIGVEEVVPGDIVLFGEGDKFPADIRLYKEFSLYVDEAILTGESQPVKKQLNPVDKKLILADRTNLGYMNTIITRGNGEGIVIGTGMHTEIGKIATSLQQEEIELSPFQKEVNRFGKLLGIVILIICAAVFVTELILILSLGSPDPMDELIEAFEIAISLAVSAVPEGLIVVITVVMSIGMRKMADKNALVRKLTAVETLGRVNVICSDKTGTLTKNEMTVVKVFIGGNEYNVEGVGYALEGKIIGDKGKQVQITDYLKKYLEVCMFCNNSNVSLRNDGTSDTDVVGDPTEISMKVLAMKMELGTKSEKIAEIPFNSDRKMMSVAVEIDNKLYSLIKGAPDILLNNAGYGVDENQVKPINDVREKILEKNEEFAKNALRVLGVAYKPLDEGYKEEEMEQDYIYLGLAGIIDPARDEVKDAIEEARMAGIRTIMITGDHKITAIAIAQEIGLTESSEAITGIELEEMSDDELRERVKTVDVFARVTSEHKLRIMRRLKELDLVISMTGDGVNDAPAVKGAHVGVAMGLKGTEVTQEASEMILIDDNYATIVNAIEEGRGIFETTKGFFRYMLSTNFDEIFLILTAYILMKLAPNIFLALPVIPIQILWLNIATDGLPAMVLGLTPTDPDVMKERPRKGFTLLPEIKGPVLLLGIYTSITDITLYLLLWGVLIPGWAQAGVPGLIGFDPTLPFAVWPAANFYAIALTQTIIFTNLVVCELLFVYTCTSNIKPFYLFPNKHLFWATGLSFGLQLLILFTPMGLAFHVVPLFHPYFWITLILAAFSVSVVDELRKWRIRKKRGMRILRKS